VLEVFVDFVCANLSMVEVIFDVDGMFVCVYVSVDCLYEVIDLLEVWLCC